MTTKNEKKKTENAAEKKQYIVTIPIAGSISFEVEAEDEAGAKEAAWDLFGDEGPEAGQLEWELLDHIVEGNVLHAPCNDVTVEEV